MKRVRRLSQTDRVVVRTQSGRFTKQNKSKRLIYEVFGKTKSGKLKSKGFLNFIDKKTKKPIPKFLTKSQIDILRRVEPREKVKVSSRGLTFMVNSRSSIRDQVYGNARKIMREYRRAHSSFEEFISEVLVSDPRGSFENITGGAMLIKQKEKLNSDRALGFIFDAILRALSRMGKRMSPKKVATHPGKKHIRRARVEIVFSV